MATIKHELGIESRRGNGFLSGEAAEYNIRRILKSNEIPSQEELVKRGSGVVIQSLGLIAGRGELTYLPATVQDFFGEQINLSDKQTMALEAQAEKFEERYQVES